MKSLFDWCKENKQEHLLRELDEGVCGIDPKKTAYSSQKKVAWRCEKGHRFYATIANRTRRRSGCPVCSNHRVLVGFNDLATTHPEVAAEWHPTRNEELNSFDVVAGSNKKVWWKCPEGHVWKTSVNNRAGAKPTGCPICAGVAKTNARYQMTLSAGI